MNKLLTIGLSSVFALYSCGETSTSPTSSESNHGYFPVTVGSTWTYESNENGIITQTISKIIGDSSISGKKYLKWVPTVRQTGSDFFLLLRRSNDSLFIYDKNRELHIFTERDGATWTVETTTDTTVYAISKVSAGRTVKGKFYNDVLYVNTKTTGRMFNGELIVMEEEQYLAKDVGMIEEVHVGSNYTKSLVSYTIK